MPFHLSPVIQTLSTHVDTFNGQTASFQFRLSNDARFFWVLIIPEIADIVELHDMKTESATELFLLARALGNHLQETLAATKINSASIGNIVPQLHYHVVARFDDDAAWPGPIWGHGTPEPTSADMISERSSIIRAFLATQNQTKPLVNCS